MTLRHPEFERLYASEIAPLVATAEQKVRRLRKTRQPIAIGVALVWAIAVMAGVYVLSPTQPLAVLIGLGVFGLFGAGVLFGAIRHTGSESYARQFAVEIATLMVGKCLGAKFIAHPKRTHVGYREFADLGGFEKLSQPRLRYGLAGVRNGRAFRVVHAFSGSAGAYSSSERMSGPDHHSVSFNGLIIEVDIPTSDGAVVVWRRDWLKDALSSLAGGEAFQEVLTGEAAFDERYGMRASGQGGAGSLLGRDFARAFLAMERDLFEQPVTLSAAVLEGRFFLSVSRPGKNALSDLEPRQSYESGLTYEERARRAYHELALAGEIVGRLPL